MVLCGQSTIIFGVCNFFCVWGWGVGIGGCGGVSNLSPQDNFFGLGNNLLVQDNLHFWPRKQPLNCICGIFLWQKQFLQNTCNKKVIKFWKNIMYIRVGHKLQCSNVFYLPFEWIYTKCLKEATMINITDRPFSLIVFHEPWKVFVLNLKISVD